MSTGGREDSSGMGLVSSRGEGPGSEVYPSSEY